MKLELYTGNTFIWRGTVSLFLCVRVWRDRHAQEGRLKSRLRSVQLAGNTLSGSASYLKRDGTICVAQDLFPGDNDIFNFTNTVRGERECKCERHAFLPNLCLHGRPVAALPQTSREDVFSSGGLNNFSLCSFALVYPTPVIKGSMWGRRKGRDSLYHVAVAICTSHFLCRPVRLAWLKHSSVLL